MFLQSVKAVLFDMDGVIYVGNRPLPGVQDLLDYLEDRGCKWLFVTNNSSKTPEQFAETLAKMKIRATPDKILGSAEATAGWLRNKIGQPGWPEGKVIVLGQESLRSMLQRAGFELTQEIQAATYAVSGINFHLTYNDLADFALAVRHGARFIATNDDPTYPSERGQIPGTGSIIALLRAATSVQPEVIGKPYPGMYLHALQRLGVQPNETLMVGDRYETDIAGALKLGLWTAGVLTGISTLKEFEEAAHPPHLIAAGLEELLQAFRSAERRT